MEIIEQIFFRKINPSDFRNMYGTAIPASGGGQTYIEAAGIPEDALIAFLDYAEKFVSSSQKESRMSYRLNCYTVAALDEHDFIEFQPRLDRNYRIVRQTVAHRHPAWKPENGFPVPQVRNGTYVDDPRFSGIIDNLLIAIIRTSYRKYYAWYINEPTMPHNWPSDLGLEAMFTGERRGILKFSDATLGFKHDASCPFEIGGARKGVVICSAADRDTIQLITYGAPGTGKSYQTEEVVKQYADTVRTTFHPDSDYATFVGCYKPTVEKKPKYGPQGLPIKANGVELTEEVITYAYVPQAFAKAYLWAWKKMAEASADDNAEHQFLVIEEINRGNCAQIFGDLFQLLDRDDEGYSKYSIEADSDLGKFIADTMSEWPAAMQAHIPDEVRSGKKMVLPPNFYIWATMNTSDQSLFPIDSAFKRRWDWQYIPIRDAGKGWKICVEVPGKEKAEYDWWAFLDKINGLILAATQSEDKQLGYFFAKPDEGSDVITTGKFVNKVLFYLYNDAFKDYDLPEGFEKPGGGKFAFKDFFLADGKPNGSAVAELLDALLGKGE